MKGVHFNLSEVTRCSHGFTGKFHTYDPDVLGKSFHDIGHRLCELVIFTLNVKVSSHNVLYMHALHIILP